MEDFLRSHISDLDTVREHYAYSLPQNGLTFDAFSDMRHAVIGSGSHFFAREAVQYHRSQVWHYLYGHRFFVESGAPDADSPRRYTVRWAYRAPTSGMIQIGRLDTDFPTLEDAREAAKQLSRRTPLQRPNG